MSIDITPEIIRAVRDQLFEPLDHVHAVLTTAAADLEREQADEKRIDELAWEIFDQVHGYGSWEDLNQKTQGEYRRAARAVLAKLDADTVDAEVYGVRDNGDVLLTASDAASVKAVLRFIFGRNAGQPYPKADIETLKVYFWPERVDEPRTWDDLRDVPDEVRSVIDNEQKRYRRFRSGPRGWEVHATGTMWSRGMDDDLTECGPFVEVPDNA